MNKKIFLAIVSSFSILAMSGCANSLHEKNRLLETEEGKSNIGKFPIYYKDIIDGYFKSDTNPLFTPTKYVTNEKLYGWMTCIKKDDIYQLIMLKENKILSVDSSKEYESVTRTCKYFTQNKTESYKDFWYEANREVERLSSDSSKESLFGVVPTNPLKLIQDYLENSLKDPSAAKYKDMEIKKYYIISNHKLTFGYLVSVQINGKNSYGAYTGYKSHFFKIKNNQIIESF